LAISGTAKHLIERIVDDKDAVDAIFSMPDGEGASRRRRGEHGSALLALGLGTVAAEASTMTPASLAGPLRQRGDVSGL